KKGIELTRTAIKRLKILYSVISKYNDNIEPIYISKSALKIGSISIRLLKSPSSLGLELS
ncbi:uncharacterized protein CLUP02_02888, partial [Colletotrichum lupini]